MTFVKHLCSLPDDILHCIVTSPPLKNDGDSIASLMSCNHFFFRFLTRRLCAARVIESYSKERMCLISADAILKDDFMRRYLEQTGKLEEAIRLAGRHRFRPVMMTTVTTILGLLPMLIPLGDGYAFRQSLALALTGGLLTSTLLTLFVIPIVFRRLHKKW